MKKLAIALFVLCATISWGQNHIGAMGLLFQADGTLVTTSSPTPPNALNSFGFLVDSTGALIVSGAGGGGAPSGAAGGDLGGTYPNPTAVGLHLTETAINFASSPYTVTVTDSYITCNATAGAVVINLPAATGSGRYIGIKKIDSSANACTPTRAGADLIDGGTTYSLTSQYAASVVIDTASAVWSRTHVNQLGGDVTGISTANTVKSVNGTLLSGLATGILKNTTGTGVPSIAVGSDILAACTTCATTTNGGALAGTANQIAVSAAGVFSITSPFTFPGNASIASASTLDWNGDTILARDGATNTLALKNGTTGQKFRVYDSTTGPSYMELSDASVNAKISSVGSSSTLFFNVNGADRWEISSSGHFFPPTSNSLDVGVTGGTVRNVVAGGGYTVQYTATAALTAGQVVKIDPSNANAVIVAATTDTGAGIPVGIVINSPGIAGNAEVLIGGQTATPLLGTGTCATLGQFVIVDTTTAGRVKCTATYTAGTVIGKVTTVQSTVGSAVGVFVHTE